MAVQIKSPVNTLLAEVPPLEAVLRLVNGYRLSQMLSIAARLGLANVFKSCVRSIEDLATATHTDAASLYRVVRALASVGCFVERSRGWFELASLGETLGDDAPISLRGAATMIGADWHWQTWSRLDQSVTSGRSAFESFFGCDFYQYYQEHACVREQFNRASGDLAALADAGILASYDFSRFRHIVHASIGGGDGKLIAKLLQRYPHLKATFCDLPSVTELARETMVEHGVEERCTLHPWQHHEPLPSGGDVYMLRNVLRDVGDKRAIEILERCAHTIGPSSSLLLVEMLVSGGNSLSLAKLLDIDALLFTSEGRERGAEQYRLLLNSAGCDVLRVLSTPGPLSIIECTTRRCGEHAPSPLASSMANQSLEISESMPPHLKMVRMLGGFRIARLISLACQLRIADHLGARPLSVQSLAQQTGSNPQALFRVLRALAGVGIFAENERGEIALTPRATCLRSDINGSAYECALVFGESWHWDMWGRLLDTVRTGQPAFNVVRGASFHTTRQQEPVFANRIDASQASVYSPSDEAIVETYKFSAVKKLIHVGAGHASLTARILVANPAIEAVAYDIASARSGAERVIKANRLGRRCKIVSGSYFDQIPTGDTILLRGLIHYWNDDRATAILRRCGEALARDGRLLIVEMLMPHNNELFVGKFIDVESMLLTEGGRERSLMEYQTLLKAAGFVVTAVIRTKAPISIIEARHAAVNH